MFTPNNIRPNLHNEYWDMRLIKLTPLRVGVLPMKVGVKVKTVNYLS